MLKIYYLKLKDFEKYHITKFEIKYRLVKLFFCIKMRQAERQQHEIFRCRRPGGLRGRDDAQSGRLCRSGEKSVGRDHHPQREGPGAQRVRTDLQKDPLRARRVFLCRFPEHGHEDIGVFCLFY